MGNLIFVSFDEYLDTKKNLLKKIDFILFEQSRKKTTREQLEKIQDEIDRIENYKISSFVQRKNCVAILYFLSFLTYVTGCGFIYLRFERSNKPLILISSAFLILFPVM